MAVTRTTHTGFFGNLFNSIVAVPIGILIFLASFVVLFMNEGRPNLARIAEKDSVAVAADSVGSEGAFVSVTGPLETTETVGDPEYIAPGPYISLAREVEVYAWVEHSETQTRDKVGGGTETTTTYTYSQEWTTDPPDSSRFQEPAGHHNQPQRVSSNDWSVQNATIGAWRIDVPRTRMPGGETVPIAQLQLLGKGGRGTVADTYLYLGTANPAAPVVGDHRISFRVLLPGGTVTGFGKAAGGALAPWEYESGKTFLRVLNGTREEAIAQMEFEEKLIAWGLRILGFFMMWVGMGMVFSPLHTIAGILPFAKKATKFVISLVTFPIALVLTTVTVVVSMILHSVVALIIVFVLVGGLAFFLWKRRDKDAATGLKGAPPMAPPMAPPTAPPGPPPM